MSLLEDDYLFQTSPVSKLPNYTKLQNCLNRAYLCLAWDSFLYESLDAELGGDLQEPRQPTLFDPQLTLKGMHIPNRGLTISMKLSL